MQDMFSLAGKTALVTGATSGIGLAIAQAFSAAGANLVISSIDAAACQSVSEALHGNERHAFGIPCDVLVDPDLDALVEGALRHFGAVDILVVNAGGQVTPDGRELSANSAALDATLRLSLGHAVRLTDRLIPGMAARREGSVILMSSISGLRGNKTLGSYALAKAAMAQLARNLRSSPVKISSSTGAPSSPTEINLARSGHDLHRPIRQRNRQRSHSHGRKPLFPCESYLPGRRRRQVDDAAFYVRPAIANRDHRTAPGVEIRDPRGRAERQRQAGRITAIEPHRSAIGHGLARITAGIK